MTPDRIDTVALNDNGISFNVATLEAEKPTHIVLFAAGAGGSPERHLPLLSSLAEHGFVVVAPYFERLQSPMPTEAELLVRSRRLKLALDFAYRPNLTTTGLGHSIGATVLLALAGGQMWLSPNQRLNIEPEERLKKLVLFAPATGFFQPPEALDSINIPMFVWAGSNDGITPPIQAEFLKRSLERRVSIGLRIVDGASHFSFMNSLPPQIVDPLAEREAFLAELGTEVSRYIKGTM